MARTRIFTGCDSVTYLTTSSFTVYLLPFLLRRAWKRYHGTGKERGIGPFEEYEPLVDDETHPRPISPYRRSISISRELPPHSNTARLTTRETAQLASVFCFLWFVANWTLNAGLEYTSVASATILSSMSGFFTMVIGRLFKVEMLSVAKVSAVVASFVGVILVSLSDSGSSNPSSPIPNDSSQAEYAYRPLLGDALALMSAFFYALYVTLLKVRIGSESRIDMQLFFGFVGLFNIIGCWPIGVILHLTGVEKFELPTSGRIVAALLINMGITLSSDYIYVLAMLKTTPLVVTIGLSLTMPLAVVGDLLLGHTTKAQVVFGALLVLASFVVIGVEDSKEDEGRR
ncbi:hypothetical protein OF83DRAFT_524882 [Amylostereum chailletii]|nr:hypothetical protein OF83DRAFT_524882 [Amylostereum chailletii]